MGEFYIHPLAGERPSAFAERVGRMYAEASTSGSKKNKGQFFTPLSISRFMGALAGPCQDEFSVLDPGCGCAILSTCLIEYLAEQYGLSKVSLDAYETDIHVIPYTKAVLDCLKSWLTGKQISFSYQIIEKDFVLENAKCLNGEPDLFCEQPVAKYDYCISNPPYFKLPSGDVRVKAMASIVNGQTNIYALFLAIAAKMLKVTGQMIFITPRSFSSGRYFKLFREFFFSTVSLDFIHLFNTRKDTFAKDDVLQELLIMRCHPVELPSEDTVAISFSEGSSDLARSYCKIYPRKDIIDVDSKEKVLYLPVSSLDEAVLSLFKSWDGNMSKYDIQISTGPVVAFRSADYLCKSEEDDTVPLYWSHNVIKMLCDHPVEKKERCQFIKVADGTMSSLLPNKNYILLRRFSAKDDESRLVAAPYFGNSSKYKYVGIENKLNYIYRPKGHLTRSEVMGITALLNSKLFDTYFRTFNGNINVSATELRMMPFPPLETIRKIGNKIILKNNYSIYHVNEVVFEFFNIQDA
ncbi:MAG: Eco57I restriction-modification methylase domain-containing protein [Bacteroidales bacterium]|nr:Eco57I restriction-modification methylase domain-containing protein [Bacteroidales bacterium]